MAKSVNIIILASALCLFSLLGIAYSTPTGLTVVGKVYCDTCRIQFRTKLSTDINGAKVKLECRESEGGSVTYSKDGITDGTGTYKIEVEGDHEEENCEVNLVSSPDTNCNQISRPKGKDLGAKISLTTNNGISSNERQANDLGFLNNERLPGCNEILRSIGLTQEDI
ncbi:hypothetical protein UlMin_018244 [Ulmus minor]